jgi:hypothetical protein
MKPRIGSPFAILMAIALIIVGVCTLLSGCQDSATIWSAESPSPNGYWLASAKTEQFGGPGTAGVYTTVYLKQGSHSPVQILTFSNESAYPSGITSVGMNWVSASHLEVTYKGHADLQFQVVKFAGVDVSVQDLSSKTDTSQK